MDDTTEAVAWRPRGRSARPGWRWGLVLALALALAAPLVVAADAPVARPAPDEPAWWSAVEADLERVRKGHQGIVPTRYADAVARAEALGAALHASEGRSDPTGPAELALVQRAQRMGLPACSGMRYRGLFVPARPPSAAGPAWPAAVYLLGQVIGEQRTVASVHHRFTVAEDGISFDAVDSNAERCLAFDGSTGGKPHVHVLRFRACVPDEFMVNMSLQQPDDLVVMVTSTGHWLVRNGRIRLISGDARPCALVRAGEGIHGWMAVPGNPGDQDSYLIVMPYMDWQAGLSLRIAGEARREPDGRWHWVQKKDDIVVALRLVENEQVKPVFGFALSPEDRDALQLEARPDWLAVYRRLAPPDETVQIASFLNHHGDSPSAIALLEAAEAAGSPVSAQAVFELGYAYNAVRRHDSAVRLLRAAEKRRPNDQNICRELAFALARRRDQPEAIAQYDRCWPLMADADVRMRLEVAARQALMHAALQQWPQCRTWHATLQRELDRVSPAEVPPEQLTQFRAVRCPE